MTHKNLAAHTAATSPYPPYLSINKHSDGTVSVSVRQQGVNGAEGGFARIVLTEAEWASVMAQIALSNTEQPQ